MCIIMDWILLRECLQRVDTIAANRQIWGIRDRIEEAFESNEYVGFCRYEDVRWRTALKLISSRTGLR